jgi:hypothetical protein
VQLTVTSLLQGKQLRLLKVTMREERLDRAAGLGSLRRLSEMSVLAKNSKKTVATNP